VTALWENKQPSSVQKGKVCLKIWDHRHKKYYATYDIHERHQQGIPHYREVMLLSCIEGKNNWGRWSPSNWIGDERHWSEIWPALWMAMVRRINGIIALMEKAWSNRGITSSIIKTHCIIHQEVLCAKSLKMQDMMHVVIKTVNFVQK